MSNSKSKNKWVSRARWIFVFLLIFSFFPLPYVQAAQKSTTTLKKIPQVVKKISSKKKLFTFTLSPLQKTSVTISVKNTSSHVWGEKDSLVTLVSAARYESYLHDTSWSSKNRVMALSEKISPNKSTKLSFVIEAPQQEGSYQDEFALYAGKKKITSSEFTLLLHVDSSISKKQDVSPQPQAKEGADLPLQHDAYLGGQKLIQSAYTLTLKQQERVEFRVGFKNSGTIPWKQTDTKKITLRSAATKESYFHDSSWVSKNSISQLQQDASPGQVSYFSFFLEAPLQSGSFEEKLSLYYGEDKIPESEFSLPITVQDPPALLTSFVQPPSSGLTGSFTTSTASQIIDDISEQEPFIRAGLFNTQKPITITAQKPYEVRDERNQLLAKMNAGDISTVSFDFDSKLYSFATSTQATSTTPFYLTFGPPQQDTMTSPTQDASMVFEIPSYTNKPAWSTTLNDNKFRNRLEVRYADQTQKLWVINELPFESYLKGIGETSNNSPYEFQKTLIVAARTFAKYHIDHGTKHAADNVTVLTTDADQIYRGYNGEIRLPNVSRAVDETRGIMVFYGGNLAITPYFSQSDGRTRNWGEVWGGDPKPWLISKDDPCCKNLPLLGHGVGMSARGAVMMALDGKGFEEILKYYYTGIELRRRYK